jgi:hypothetical protein
MSNGSDLKEMVTLGAALVGAVLGVMNTWNAISQNRMRLRVRPAFATAFPGGEECFCIEVVNLSAFAVTIIELGFTRRWRSLRKTRTGVIQPLVPDGKPWPRRLGSRESVTAYFDHTQIIARGNRIGIAYARTACGKVAFGMSPAARQLRSMTRASGRA